MGLHWWCSLLLAAAASLLGGCTDSSSHSLRYFYTTTWDRENLFRFFAVGYLDEQVAVSYNTDTRRAEPRLPWLKKLEKDDPHLWDTNTYIIRSAELRMKADLADIWNLYRQSTGMRTWQHMNGCELDKDGHKRASFQYAYDGEDFLSFDKETLTWTAAVAPAREIKRRWDANLMCSKSFRSYLEEECVGWLRRYLDYGKDSLARSAFSKQGVVIVVFLVMIDGLLLPLIVRRLRTAKELRRTRVYMSIIHALGVSVVYLYLLMLFIGEDQKVEAAKTLAQVGLLLALPTLVLYGLLDAGILIRFPTMKALSKALVTVSVVLALGVSMVLLSLLMLFTGGDPKMEAVETSRKVGLIVGVLWLAPGSLIMAEIFINSWFRERNYRAAHREPSKDK